MSNEFDLYLEPTTLDELSKAASRNLTLPTPEENETVRPGKEPDLGTWTEAFKIVDSSLSTPKDESKQDGSALVLKLVLEVLGPSDGGYEGNVGRVHYHNGYIEPAVLKDKSHKMHRLHARQVNIIMSAYQALGGSPSEGISLKELLNGKDGDKQLVGHKLKGIMVKSRYKSKKTGDLVETVDVTGFLPLE